MSETTTLIQRLRAQYGHPFTANGESRLDYSRHPLVGKAADVLEQQAAQIEAKDAEIAQLQRWVHAGTEQVEALRADAERLMAVTEETANMLRGMCMDPRIQKDIKEALWSRVRKLDKATEDVIDAALRQEQEGTNG